MQVPEISLEVKHCFFISWVAVVWRDDSWVMKDLSLSEHLISSGGPTPIFSWSFLCIFMLLLLWVSKEHKLQLNFLSISGLERMVEWKYQHKSWIYRKPNCKLLLVSHNSILYLVSLLDSHFMRWVRQCDFRTLECRWDNSPKSFHFVPIFEES